MRLGQVIPNFTAESTHGRIVFYDWLGDSWCILFSHPADFTPVCTSELSRIAEYHNEFWKRGVKLLALSCDRVRSHCTWIEDVRWFCSNVPTNFPFPMIGDETRELAVKLDLIDEDQKDNPEMAMTVRSLYVVGPDRKVKLTMQYPNSTGRSVAEVLRVIDSLQLQSRLKVVATPSDWEPGNEVMILPHVDEEELRCLFPSGVETVPMPSGMNYIRTTRDVWAEPWRINTPKAKPMDFHPTLAAQSEQENTSLSEVIRFIERVSVTPNLKQIPLGDLLQLTSDLVAETSSARTTGERLMAMTKFLGTLVPQ